MNHETEINPIIKAVYGVIKCLYGIEPGPQAGLAAKLDRAGSAEEHMLADASTLPHLQANDELLFLLNVVFKAGMMDGFEAERERAQMEKIYRNARLEDLHRPKGVV